MISLGPLRPPASHNDANKSGELPRLEGVGEDPFAPDDYVPWRPGSVTIQDARIPFASALDRACQQAGFRWMIEIDGVTKAPFLVVIPAYNLLTRSRRRAGGSRCQTFDVVRRAKQGASYMVKGQI